MRIPIPGWHSSFCFPLLILLLLLLLHRHRHDHSTPKLDPQMNDSSPLADGPNRRRRRFGGDSVEMDGDNPFGLGLGQMREYLSAERVNELRELAGHFGRMGKNGSANYLGTEFAEVDLERLDRESVARLEMRAILEGMAREGLEKELREWMGEEAEIREEEMGAAGQQKRANAWDVCLGQHNSLCNSHLPPNWPRCSCQIVPHQGPHPAPCSASLSAQIHSNVQGRVFSLALGFPLPPIFGHPLLQEHFLAHWIARLFAPKLRWDQVLIVGKACLSEGLFALQIAFLRESATRQCPLNGQLGEEHLLELAQIGAHNVGQNWVWMGQASVEKTSPIQLDHLLSDRMDQKEQMPFFLSKIAQIPDRPCLPPWDYSSFVRCHPQHLLFLAFGSILAVGLPLGLLRFWHQIQRKREAPPPIGGEKTPKGR